MTEPPLWRGRWVLYAAGAAMVGYGTWGQLFGADTKPRRYAELLLVAALGHDLVLAPLVLLLGLLARKVLHRHVHGVLQGAALVGFVLLVVALPGMGRYGARSDNASILPRDYTSGLMVALGAVAVGALLVVLVRVRRRSGG
ncbi:MAG: hypothetical protein ACXVFV_00455 [Mycobacteriales bacterium]